MGKGVGSQREEMVWASPWGEAMYSGERKEGGREEGREEGIQHPCLLFLSPPWK